MIINLVTYNVDEDQIGLTEVVLEELVTVSPEGFIMNVHVKEFHGHLPEEERRILLGEL